MTGAILSVAAAGPQVTVQDGGRPGLMRYGVPASGPMDRLAFAAAQAAVGNPPGGPAIEISRGGLTLDCAAGALTVAVAGGGFVVEAGDRRLGSWAVFGLEAGERLAIRPGPWGSWAYLAVAGTLRTPRWLGSAATHGPSGLGGGAIAAGDTLRVGGAARRPERHGPVPCPVAARPRRLLRVVTGPQDRFFAPGTLDLFLDAAFALTDAGDRMGLRLAGPPLAPAGPLDMASEPVARGSVQVAGDGVATVLMADHQTTGGYPRIATVIDPDLDGLAQLRPRDRVAFRAVTPAAAVAVARRQAARRGAWLGTLALRRGR